MTGLKPLDKIRNVALWMNPIYGAEGGEGGDGGGDGGDGGDGGQGGNDGGDGGDGGDNENEKDKDKTDFSGIEDPQARRIAELSSEAAQRRRERNQARAEKAEMEKQLAKATRKGTEAEVSDEARELIEKPHLEAIAKRDEAMKKVLLESAINAEGLAGTAKERVWHSVQDVLLHIDADEIDFDPESGTIEGVSEALERIAKEKPYLVKSTKKGKDKDKDKDKDNEGGSGNGTPAGKRGPSGAHPGGNGGAGAPVQGLSNERRKELAGKFKIRR